MSDEKINSIKTPNHSITPNLSYYGTKTRVEINRSCLNKGKVTFNHGRRVAIYTVYDISRNINISDYPTLENNADIDKYKYSGYRIRFDRHGSFSFSGIGLGKNVIIFGVNMSSSVPVDNNKKDILISGKGPTQG